MATIQPVSIEEALSRRTRRPPSARTLRTRRLERDAAAVVEAIQNTGAAVIDVMEEEGAPERYLAGLRAALARRGEREILLQKKRGRPQIVAWQARQQDRGRLARRGAGSRPGPPRRGGPR